MNRKIIQVLEQDCLAKDNLTALINAVKTGVVLQEDFARLRSEIIKRALARDHELAKQAWEKRKYARLAFDYRFNNLADRWPVNIKSKE